MKLLLQRPHMWPKNFPHNKNIHIIWVYLQYTGNNRRQINNNRMMAAKTNKCAQFKLNGFNNLCWHPEFNLETLPYWYFEHNPCVCSLFCCADGGLGLHRQCQSQSDVFEWVWWTFAFLVLWCKAQAFRPSVSIHQPKSTVWVCVRVKQTDMQLFAHRFINLKGNA